MNNRKLLEAAVVALEAQRELVGDAVTNAALAPMLTRLALTQQHDQVLRQVTMVFMDMVGSTALGHQLDAEDMHVVMDGLLARATAIVALHGGKVLQYAGDSLLAVFGSDEAREDDPEHAVRTGLSLLEEGQRWGQYVQRRHGHQGFDVRVGIHTGKVLLGGGIDSDRNVRGVNVHIAARMEQTAPVGGLQISHDTYQHVRGTFETSSRGLLEVKGLSAPMQTHLVMQAKPRTFRASGRGVEGVETRMIGRNSELAELETLLKQAIAERIYIAVTVIADAGIGKSRLLSEFENSQAVHGERIQLFRGRGTLESRNQPYALLRDIVAWWLRIGESDSMAVAKQKVERGIVPLFQVDSDDELAEAHAHLLGYLIGLDFSESKHIAGIRNDPKQVRDRGFNAMAQVFRRVAATEQASIVLFLDDLHWADDGSLEFLSYLAQVNRDVPMLQVSFGRPSLIERRPAWGVGVQHHKRMDLSPLRSDFSQMLANELLKNLPEIPDTLRDMVTMRAEGNPYYMEELVKMLIDEGAIKTDGAHWRVHEDRLRTTRVPQTLTGVLQARLDSLTPAEKLALQQAAVIGSVFWDQALAAIDVHGLDSLPGITRRKLVSRLDHTSVEGAGEYAFKHQILHHVTYDTVLKQVRRKYHSRAAAWLAGLSDSQAQNFLGVAAEHFESAGENKQACEYFDRAARHAAGRYAHGTVLSHTSHAIELAEAEEHEVRWSLHEVRERTLNLLGRRAEQQRDLEAMQRLAEEMDDDRHRGEVAWRRSRYLRSVEADFNAMEEAARRALLYAESCGDTELWLRAQHSLADSHCARHDMERGKALATVGLQRAREFGMRRLEASFLNMLCYVAAVEDQLEVSLQLNESQLRIERETGDRAGEANALACLGCTWNSLGQSSLAQEYWNEGLSLLRAIGNRPAQTFPLGNLALVCLYDSKNDQALAYASHALEIAVEVSGPAIQAMALLLKANAELALGRYAQAMEGYAKAHELSLRVDSDMRFDAEAGMAQVALAQGDMACALQHTEALMTHSADGGTMAGSDAQSVRLTCHQVLSRMGDPRAAQLLDSLYVDLQARAAKIGEERLRASFLDNIPNHREIVAAWRAARALH